MSSTKPDFDALMVDWLYGELNPAEAADFEKHLASHPEAKAEAEALRQTRAAFQDIDEAEPSTSLSAILMHEAAQAVAPSETLWSRFAALFQPLVMHPAASAMATLVLVCGVAGALYLRDGTKVVEPSAKSEASAPADVASLQAARDPSPEAPAPESAEFDGDDYGADVSGEDGLGFAVGLADGERQQAIEAAQLQGGLEGRVQEPAESVVPARIVDTKREESKEKSNRSYDRTSAGSKAALADNLDEAFLQPDSKPATGSRSLSKTTPGDLNAAPAKKVEKKQADKLPPWEQTQNQNLQLAAQGKRCKEVGRIANDILDKNTAFYKQEVATSKGAEDCRYFIASETQRRVKSRAKQAAARAKSKQGESVPKKALASPRRDSDLEAAD